MVSLIEWSSDFLNSPWELEEARRERDYIRCPYADCFDTNVNKFNVFCPFSNGQCGEELGEIMLNLAKSWEQADTSTSRTLASKLPLLESSLTDNAKSGMKKTLAY